jgi:hypothetical protein
MSPTYSIKEFKYLNFWRKSEYENQMGSNNRNTYGYHHVRLNSYSCH